MLTVIHVSLQLLLLYHLYGGMTLSLWLLTNLTSDIIFLTISGNTTDRKKTNLGTLKINLLQFCAQCCQENDTQKCRVSSHT